MTASPRDTGQHLRVRRLDRAGGEEVDLVAERMRATLIEVLGHDAGASMYTMEWLRDRVRWHMDPGQCLGEVFVAEDGERRIVGHTIVRVEGGGEPVGLFSTTYVEPAARRRGVAEKLLRRGEAWLAARGMTTLATNTSATNAPLIRLFAKHGYAIVLEVAESGMVRLEKSVAAGPGS